MNFEKSKILFSLNVKIDKNGDKEVYPPFEWTTLRKSKIDKKHTHRAILTGEINDLTIIDFDGDEGMILYNKYLELFENTFIETSTRGFKHAYFKFDADFKSGKSFLSKKIDILNNKKFCIMSNDNNKKEIQFINPEFKKILLNGVKSNVEKSNTEDSDKIRALIKLIDVKYSDNYKDWIKIGLCLKQIVNDDDEGYDIWNDFSKLSNKYNVKKNKEQWNTFNNINNFNIKTLFYYTKLNKKGFKEWNKSYKTDDVIINEIEILNKFDLNEEYDFCDFQNYLFKTIFDDVNDAVRYIELHLYRVCVKVNDYMITKQPNTEFNNIHSIEQFTTKWRAECEVKYMYFNDFSGKDELKELTLRKFLSIYPHLINCFKRVNTEFIIKGDTLNKDEFYITEEFKADYIENINETDILKIQPLLDMIMLVYCNNDVKIYDMILSLFSFWVCNPNEKSGKCLILTGEQGTGKSTIIEYFMDYIFGNKICLMLKGFKELLSDKNGHLSGKKFTNLNETKSKKGDYLTNFDDMKTLISDKTISIRGLYKETKNEKSSMEIIITTNNPNCCPIEKNDRKYIVLHVNDIYLQKDKEFWSPFREQIFNQKTANIFYSYLINMNTTTEKWRSIDFKELNTDLKKDLILLNKNSIELFIIELKDEILKNKDKILETERLTYNKITYNGEENESYDIQLSKNKDKIKVKPLSLYEGYKAYCHYHGEQAVKYKYFNFDLTNKLKIELKFNDGYKKYMFDI